MEFVLICIGNTKVDSERDETVFVLLMILSCFWVSTNMHFDVVWVSDIKLYYAIITILARHGSAMWRNEMHLNLEKYTHNHKSIFFVCLICIVQSWLMHAIVRLLPRNGLLLWFLKMFTRSFVVLKLLFSVSRVLHELG